MVLLRNVVRTRWLWRHGSAAGDDMADGLPTSGLASTYADHFDVPGRPALKTATGEPYSHLGYTAALLPRARWCAVPMGTLLRLG